MARQARRDLGWAVRVMAAIMLVIAATARSPFLLDPEPRYFDRGKFGVRLVLRAAASAPSSAAHRTVPYLGQKP